MVQVLAVGLLAGWHAANWGAYKDTPYEGFRWASYVRSVVVAGAAALVLGWLAGFDSVPSLLVLLGMVYTIERFATEWWKSIVREQDQSVYTIPMRLGVRGRTVDRRGRRYAVGIGTVVVLVLLAGAGELVQRSLPPQPWLVTVLVGGGGGWLTAVGGAWKDAPIEGFSGWKFLRSPVVATAWAVPLSALTDSWVVLAISAAGFAVAGIDNYQTFLTGGRPPGKFADKPVRYVASTARGVFALLHALLWAALALGIAVSVSLGLVAPTQQFASSLIGLVALVLAGSVPVALSWVTLRRRTVSVPGSVHERADEGR